MDWRHVAGQMRKLDQIQANGEKVEQNWRGESQV